MSMNFQYIIKEGFLGLRRTRVATAVTVSTIAVTLFLLCIFLILTLNIGQFVGFFHDKILINVFIDNSIQMSEIEALKQQLMDCPGIQSIDFITSDMAMEQFRKELGSDIDPFELLGGNPLPASFRVYLLPSFMSPEHAKETVACLESKPGIDQVLYEGRLFQMMQQYKKGVFISVLILFLIVLIAALFLVSNTLRLTIYAQKDKIAIMELVGATPALIRRPYIIQGQLQGMIGGGTGMVLIWILVHIVQLRFPHLLIVPIWAYLSPLVLGIFIGHLGSVLGVKRFLRA